MAWRYYRGEIVCGLAYYRPTSMVYQDKDALVRFASNSPEIDASQGISKVIELDGIEAYICISRESNENIVFGIKEEPAHDA